MTTTPAAPLDPTTTFDAASHNLSRVVQVQARACGPGRLRLG